MSLIAKNQRIIGNSESKLSKILELAESYLQKFVAPLASKIDTNPCALKTALQGMGERSLLALRVSKYWGGSELNEETYRRFQQLVPRYSGALAFLQTQHQSAAEFINNSQNEALKQYYLPHMGKGEILVGVGFSHLRRQGDPLVQAIPIDGGYQLQGQVPWITGFGLFQDFILAATLPDGQAVYGMMPFQETMQAQGSMITFSEPMQLAAITSTNTVTATISNWFLAEEQVVFVKPAGAIQDSDSKNVLNQGFACLGCAKAALDLVEAAYHTKQLAFIGNAFTSLDQELTSCQAAMLAALAPNSHSWSAQLQLRAWAINLVLRCASAAVTVSSGAANYPDHPAQRVYREALVFTVSGQTTAVMEATLTQLVGKR